MSLKTETTLPRRRRKRSDVPSSTVKIIDLCDSDEVKVLNFIPPKPPSTKRRKRFERGECSKDAPFVCEICTDTKTMRDSFSITGCSHAYCSDSGMLMASCEAMIVASEKFYCPFKNCSALLIDDGKEKVRESECPNCRRLFQKLGKDERRKEDLMLIKLAKDKKWRRCPNCKLYVAKTSGCLFIRCRCGSNFCYNCGTPNTTMTHYCNNCNRTY